MSLTSSEEEAEPMEADNSRVTEDDLQRIQQDMETTPSDKKRERTTNSSEGE